MTKQCLHLRIISTSKIEYDDQIDMVLLPGEDGEFGVLVHHMNMIANLKQGVVKIHSGGKLDTVDINGGVVSISEGSRIDVLVT
jgi:F-type H+-transporting ATPase subunit epsilon